MNISRLVAGLLVSISGVSAQILGPTPYMSSADSPFSGTIFSYFALETFESGALNTPGVQVNPEAVVIAPGTLTDSVDADDGSIDGFGTAGHSLYSANRLLKFSFTFDAAVLGALPTHAGIVWTDVGNTETGVAGIDTFTFEAFDAANISLGTTVAILGDGISNGQTGEDRFFGAVSAEGISRITLRAASSRDWEVDHLQFGRAAASPVPEPSTFAWGFVALAGLCVWNRRRKTGLCRT